MEATNQGMQLDLGHWLLRLIALIIDGVILGVVLGVLAVILALFSLLAGGLFGFWFSVTGGLLAFLALGILMIFYFPLSEVWWGASLGKRIVGLRVQTVNGGKVTLGQAFIRNISKIFWPLLLLDWLIGIATPGDRRQKYSDRMAGTVVVQAGQAFASITPPPPPPSQ